MPTPLHLVKLCVGADDVADLARWQADRAAEATANGRDPIPFHVTRMWPRREAELLAGGSLYWVIKGIVQARQSILELRPVRGADGVDRCGIVLDPELHRTEYRPCRAFQGWRYYDPKDAPADIRQSSVDGDMPEGMRRALRELALI